jgi:hypothetical protein
LNTAPPPAAPTADSRLFRFLLAEPVPGASRPFDRLTSATLIYLAIPNLIFVFGWFKLPVAVVLALLILAALYQGGVLRITLRPAHSRAALAFLIAVGLAWTAFGGAGHLSHANADWFIRDAVYADLFKNAWPISYGTEGGSPLILRSAIGFFLPGALLTQWLGPAWANIVLYFWTAAGVILFLALLPLPQRLGWRMLLCTLVIVFFSGMDFLGICIATGDLPIFPLRLEWWTYFSYTSISGQIFWAPNHNLPLWLGTTLYIRHATSPEFGRLAITYIPLTLIWTPFAAVGLAPFLALYAVRWWRTHSPWPHKLQLVYAITLCTLLSIFLTLNISQIEAKTGIEHAQGAEAFWRRYPLFVTVEFLTLAFLIWTRPCRVGSSFVLALAILLVLPFTFFGPSNDLLLRASVPPLLILMGHALSLFNQAPPHRQTFPWAITVVLVVGAATPFNEMWRAATWPVRPANYRMTLIEATSGYIPPHYIGKLDLPWLAAILKPPQVISPRSGQLTSR